MREPTLVILAAGLGSRYGGLKQIDSVSEKGKNRIKYLHSLKCYAIL